MPTVYMYSVHGVTGLFYVHVAAVYMHDKPASLLLTDDCVVYMSLAKQ